MTAPQSRPRVVNTAFWCWVVAAVLLTLAGLLMTASRDDMPIFFRGVGVLFIVSGLALAYLANRARAGNAAFRRAAVGLALAVVVVLAIFSLMTRGFVLVFTLVLFAAMVLAMVGAVAIMRPSSQKFFEQEGSR